MKRTVILDFHGFRKEIDIEVVNLRYCYLPRYITHVFRKLPTASLHDSPYDLSIPVKAYMKEIVFYQDHAFNGGTPVYYARDI
jgi:hypothetical protein